MQLKKYIFENVIKTDQPTNVSIIIEGLNLSSIISSLEEE